MRRRGILRRKDRYCSIGACKSHLTIMIAAVETRIFIEVIAMADDFFVRSFIPFSAITNLSGGRKL